MDRSGQKKYTCPGVTEAFSGSNDHVEDEMLSMVKIFVSVVMTISVKKSAGSA